MTWFRCGMKKGISVSDYNALIDRSVTSVISSAAYVGSYAFRDCRSLTSVSFPNATRIYDYAFTGCRELTSIEAPMVELLSGSSFSSCIALEEVTFENVRGISSTVFANSTNFKSITLMYSSMCTLNNVNAFTGTQFDTTGSGGTVYVPSDLVTEYQNDANWAALLALNANNKIEAIT